MKILSMFAAAGLALSVGMISTPAEAQGRHNGYYNTQRNFQHDQRAQNNRYGRDYRGARAGRTWYDAQGRLCYRRADGVRRCNAVPRGRRGW